MQRYKKNSVILLSFAGIFLGIFVMSKSWFLEEYQFEESKMAISGPAQGYYMQIDSQETHRIAGIANDGDRLALVTMDLSKMSNKPIPNSVLAGFKKTLEAAEKNHVGIIFRAAYGFSGEAKEPKDKEQIKKHIKQIAEVINEQKKSIVSIQAGMLGAYGEWHSSRFLTGKKSDKTIRLFVLKAWEKYLSKDIKISIRRPSFIREAMKEGILKNRLSFHNDGLLGSANDLGTYVEPSFSREKELKWADSNLLGQHNGGEMPYPNKWSKAANANKEFKKLHLSYLNRYYNTEVLKNWSKEKINGQNANTYIKNHLGVRFYVSKIWAESSTGFEKDNMIYIKLHNSGYQTLSKKYNIYFVLQTDSDVLTYPMSSDKLYELCNNQSSTLFFKINFLSIKETESVRIGIKIAESETDIEPLNQYGLANDGFLQEDGTVWLMEYKKEDTEYQLNIIKDNR